MSTLDKQMPSDAPTSQGHIGKSHNKILAFGKTEGNHFAQKSGNFFSSLQDIGELGYAAINLAEGGFEVFPLKARSKIPATVNGHLSATSDIDKIAAWWRENPDCNIGLLPGEMSNGKSLAVLDVDPRNKGDETLATLIAEHGGMPDTLTALSGRGDGGAHHYFYVPDDVARSCADAVGVGLDIKSSNGYVVAAPSIHPDTSMPYGWTGGVDLVGAEDMAESIADMPEWMVSKLRSRNGSVRDRERLDRVGGRTADPQQFDDLKSALLHIPADGHDTWVRMGMALYELGDVGKELWIEWSMKSDKYSPSEAAKKWRKFAKTEDLHFESVFHEAGKHGWVNPLEKKRGIEDGITLDCLKRLIQPLDHTDAAFEEHPHIIEHILPCEETTLLAGHGGSGKSFVSLVMAIHVVMGLPFQTLRVKQSSVLFFSAEDSRRTLHRRIANICRVLNIDSKALDGKLLILDVSDIDPALHRKSSSADNKTPLMGELIRLVESGDVYDVGLVIVDNASDTFDDDENVRAPVRKFVRSLRGLASSSRAVLLLTHVNKASAGNRGNVKGGTEDYSGSSAWHNSARARLSLAKGESDGELVLTHQKANYGALTAPIELVWNEGVPIPKGELTKPIEDRRALIEKAKWEEDKDALYQVLLACEGDAIHAPCARTGSVNAFKHLSVREGFPSTCNSDRTNMILQELFREGLIYVSAEKTGPRNRESNRWRCSIDAPDLV